jgi:hypothetical protein
MVSNAEMEEAAAKQHMDRRVIRVECLPDQAGIAAALRRAFAAGALNEDESDRMFDDLLRQLH